MSGEFGVFICLYPAVWSVQAGTAKYKPRTSTNVDLELGSAPLLPWETSPSQNVSHSRELFPLSKTGTRYNKEGLQVTWTKWCWEVWSVPSHDHSCSWLIRQVSPVSNLPALPWIPWRLGKPPPPPKPAPSILFICSYRAHQMTFLELLLIVLAGSTNPSAQFNLLNVVENLACPMPPSPLGFLFPQLKCLCLLVTLNDT